MTNKNTTPKVPHPQSLALPRSLGMPVGSVIAFAGELRFNPDDLKEHKTSLFMSDWLLCNGQSVNIAEFPDLFAALGFRYGGDQTSNFVLPNYQGTFLRGVDGILGKIQHEGSLESRKAISGGEDNNGVGSTQGYALRKHQHKYKYKMTGSITPADPPKTTFLQTTDLDKTTTDLLNVDISNQSDLESRPVNTFVYWLIKARRDR